MIKNIWMKYWHMLTSDPTLSHQFKEPPNKRAPNLHSGLVQASFNTVLYKTLLTPLRDGSYPCGNCAQCNNAKNNLSSDSLGLEKHTVLKVWSDATQKKLIYILCCVCD